jgi:hypothetical protein
MDPDLIIFYNIFFAISPQTYRIFRSVNTTICVNLHLFGPLYSVRFVHYRVDRKAVCVMNSTIFILKLRYHYQNLYLEHGKARRLDGICVHSAFALLRNSSTVRQVADVEVSFPRYCGVHP